MVYQLNEGAFDLFLIYKFIKRLSTPFEKQEAFKLGLIDKSGQKIRDPETRQEKNAYGYIDRLIFNLKKIIERVPGGKHKLASFAAALFLIRETHLRRDYTATELTEALYGTMRQIREDTPTNSTGAAVIGTGDDPTVWKPKYRAKRSMAFVKRYMDDKEKKKRKRKNGISDRG